MAKKDLHRNGSSRTPNNKLAQRECYACAMRRVTQLAHGGQAGFLAELGVGADFEGFIALPGRIEGEAAIFQFLMAGGETVTVMPYRTEEIESVVGTLLATAEQQRAASATVCSEQEQTSTDVTPLDSLDSGQGEQQAIE